MKWDFIVESGTELREAIRNDNFGETIRMIEKCCQEAKAKTKDEDLLYELDEFLELIEGEDILCDEEDCVTLEDFGFDKFEELVNERLHELYNLADGYRFFISL